MISRSSGKDCSDSFVGQDSKKSENNVNLAESWNVIVMLQKRIVFVSGSAICPKDYATGSVILVIFP